MVKPLETCVARPPEGGRSFPLLAHLETVARGLGRPDGTNEERLAFLAGWMHDVGKANSKWQWYIEAPLLRKGPPHSVYGAVLFAFYAEQLLAVWNLSKREKAEMIGQALKWCRDLADHHGQLDDLDEAHTPWKTMPSQWENIDLEGVHREVCRFFPELKGAGPTVQDLKSWERHFRETWGKWYFDWASRVLVSGYETGDPPNGCLRRSTASLIRADRFDAAGIEERGLLPDEIEKALEHLERYIEKKARQGQEAAGGAEGEGIYGLRGRIHQAVMEHYRRERGREVYVLRLPTGMGKTLTSLRLAMEIARDSEKKRVVYVAPYLSILSQAAAEIAAASGLEVMEHHSLSLVEEREWDDKAMLLLESWQSPVVATTFNQLFRALFPTRAQETLRLSALQDAVVIIDEPQIVDESVWQPFLSMMQAMAREMGATVIFVTATLPPLRPGLGMEPVFLDPERIRYPDRYRVRVIQEPWSEQELVAHLIGKEGGTKQLAVILNTIGDSALVYKGLREAWEAEGDGPMLLHLHGAMTPLHKRIQIETLKDALSEGKPVWAVTTQVIEAGVDVSFQRLFRAMPVFPSVIQAAGRVNRHGVGREPGELVVFPFYRHGEKDTRSWIYRDAIVREETDRTLHKAGEWSETALYREVDDYFRRALARSNSGARMQALAEAARGRWSAVAGWSPFVEDRRRIPVFVRWGEEYLRDDHPLGAEVWRRMRSFGIESVEEIYDRYRDVSWIGSLSFVDRKRFMALLQLFIVPLTPKIAIRVAANPRDEVEIKLAADLVEYRGDTGYGHVLVGEEEDGIL